MSSLPTAGTIPREKRIRHEVCLIISSPSFERASFNQEKHRIEAHARSGRVYYVQLPISYPIYPPTILCGDVAHALNDAWKPTNLLHLELETIEKAKLAEKTIPAPPIIHNNNNNNNSSSNTAVDDPMDFEYC